MPCNVIAGMDLSYDHSKNSLEFLAIVIGMSNDVSSVIKDCGGRDIHMATIRPRKIQKNIISALRINKRNMLVFCIKRDISLLDKLFKVQKSIHSNIYRRRISKMINYMTFMEIRPRIVNYLAARGCSLTDVIFQCDSDCVMFLKQNSLRTAARGDAYIVSDIVAWANNRGLAPNGVVEIDMTKTLKDKMLRSV